MRCQHGMERGRCVCVGCPNQEAKRSRYGIDGSLLPCETPGCKTLTTSGSICHVCMNRRAIARRIASDFDVQLHVVERAIADNDGSTTRARQQLRHELLKVGRG